MKGDFTRFTFDPKKHYNRVLMQQGRVTLDADWNEQADIQKHILETEVVDVVGRSGAPIDFAGFKVEVAPNGRDLILSPGRMYLDGILCELDENLQYFEKVAFPSEKQAKIPSQNIDDTGLEKGQWIEISVKDDQRIKPQVLRIEEINAAESILTFNEKVNYNLSAEATSSGIYINIFSKIEDQPDIDAKASETYLAHLDVWERHITAVEDDDIREKALDGPDTTTRTKIEWRVKLMPCQLESISCREASLKLKSLIDPGDSRLAVRLQPSQGEVAEDPCAALSGTAYRGLENQLYLVEIHDPGEVGKATFKWSRNNGAIAFAIVDFIEDDSVSQESASSETKANPKLYKVKLQQLGWDQELRIDKGEWVEVLGDETELLGEPGTLAKVEEIDEADMILTLTADVAKHLEESNPKVRRWDINEGELEDPQLFKSILTESSSDWIELENGIEVCFKAGDYYRTGDYWMIAARNTGDIEWPHGENDFVPKFGIQHHNCILAILTRNQDGMWKLEKDCRKLFPPLTDMVFLSYAGGDGQEAMPGKELPSPLQVRVHRGANPIQGAEVRFEIPTDQGELSASEDAFPGQKNITITTGEDGIARCFWKFGEDQPEDELIWTEQVRATLLSPEQEHPPSILFNASSNAASLSYVEGDGQEAMPGEELPAPLQTRVFVGGYPLKNAEVEFKILKGQGELHSSESAFSGQKNLKVTTGEDGIARCFWKIGTDRPEGALIWIEQVEATLINPKQEHPPSMLFNTNVIALVLSYAGGDGQEAMPGYKLPEPFRVRVSRGERPVEGAEIAFKLLEGQGVLDPAGSVPTGKDGIAQCTCQFADRLDIQYIRVRAELIDVTYPDTTGTNSHPSIIFNANASVAKEVAYVPPIACTQLKDVKTVKDALDGLCRQVSFSCVGGDGQEAMPGKELPAPFRVRVSRGENPVEGAKVSFMIMEDQGVLNPTGFVLTGKDGIAQCTYQFADSPDIQHIRVRAELIDVTYPDTTGTNSHPSIIFNANASVAEQVAYAPSTTCSQLKDAKTVKDALDGLCRQVSFSYVGGDGQKAMPGCELPCPFRVRVARGSYPVSGAKVKFSIDGNKGKLRVTSGGTGNDKLEISTDENGIAACFCSLNADAKIEANLMEPSPPDQSFIRFYANVSIAEQVAYAPSGACPQLCGVNNVKDAIDKLCLQTGRTLTLTTWVHGNSLHLQKIKEKTEGDISLKYDDEEQVAVVSGKTESIAKICFSIPITSEDGMRAQAIEALLRAKANGNISIIKRFINDGESVYVLEASTIRIMRDWETYSLGYIGRDISWGIGITLVVEFSPDEGKIAQISFAAAGCKLLSKWRA